MRTRLHRRRPDTPLGHYGAALDQFHHALAALVAASAELADSCGADRTEFAELGRLSLHIAVDRATDAAELTYPEPARLIVRTVAYADLLHTKEMT